MTTTIKPWHRFAWSLFWAALLLFVALLTYNVASIDGDFTVDSLFYVDAARNLHAGRGLTQSMAELDLLIAADADLPLPFTKWPPVYPLAIAAVSGAGVSAPHAALLVAAGCVFFILAAAYLLMARVYDRSVAAVAVAALCHFTPLLLVARFAWSETTGMIFILLALFLAFAAQSGTRHRGALAFAAGCAAGFAIATRYASLPLLPFLPLITLLRGDWATTIRRAVQCFAGAAVIMLPLFLRNMLSGGRIGGPRWGSGNTALTGLQHLGTTLATAFQAQHGAVRLIQIALAIAAAVVLVRAAMRRHLGAQLHEPCIASRRWTLAAWALLYMAFLLYAQTWVSVGPIAQRLALPATLVLYLAMVAVVLRTSKLPARAAYVLSAVLIALAIHAQGTTARAVYGKPIGHPYEVERKVAKSQTLTWLAEHAGADDLIIAERGIDIPFLLGPRDTAFFPRPGRLEPHLEYPGLLAWLRSSDRACRYRQCLLILRPKDEDPEDIAQRHGPFTADLLALKLEAYPEIQLVESLDDGLVFAMRCCSSNAAD